MMSMSTRRPRLENLKVYENFLIKPLQKYHLYAKTVKAFYSCCLMTELISTLKSKITNTGDGDTVGVVL